MNNKKFVKIGFGETIITPKENLQMHGFGKSQVATGVHDDLHSRCLIVEDYKGKKFALLSISIVELNNNATAERIRLAVAEATNLPVESILLSCTHTHSGPEVETAPMEYQNFLISQIAESARLAMENLAPGRIGVGKTVQLEVGKNRRRLPYGGLHPDPELLVLRIEDISGNLRGVLFNYGCHPATLDWKNRLYSEDWPYYAIKGIKEEVGSDVWVCFLQAAQGDINTGYDSLLSAIGADMPVRDFPYIEYKGKQMSKSVLEILPNIKTESGLTVEIINDYCNLPLRKEFPVSLEEAKENLKSAEKKLSEVENNPKYSGSRKLDKYLTEILSAKQTLELAENFYILMNKKGKAFSLRDRIKLADYYLRTGRPEKISDALKKSDCMASFKNSSKCFYYLGIKEYLLTGNHKNFGLRLAKTHIKKAKEIYYKK